MWCFPKNPMWLFYTEPQYHFSRQVALDRGLEKLIYNLGDFSETQWEVGGLFFPYYPLARIDNVVVNYHPLWIFHQTSYSKELCVLENITLPLCILHLSILCKPCRKKIYITNNWIATISLPHLYLFKDLSSLVWKLHWYSPLSICNKVKTCMSLRNLIRL